MPSDKAAVEHLLFIKERLQYLDLSEYVNLKTLDCYGQDLKELDLSNNPYLEHLECGKNELTHLNLEHNTILKRLFCGLNDFSADALNAMFHSLHSNTRGGDNSHYIVIGDNPGFLTCDKSITINKGWHVYRG